MNPFTSRKRISKKPVFPRLRPLVEQNENRESPTSLTPGLEAMIGAGMMADLTQLQDDPFAAAPEDDYLETTQTRIAPLVGQDSVPVYPANESSASSQRTIADTEIVAAPPTELSFDVFLAATATLQNPLPDPFNEQKPPQDAGSAGSVTPTEPINFPRSEPNGGGPSGSPAADGGGGGASSPFSQPSTDVGDM
ncbi:MAG: hypothetical protein L0215_24345, partial [Gemmataceae bacterium]|nr:hypothetical protein [Gemmataceae bacterium]